MAQITFNIALGRPAALAALPAASDALYLIPLESSGLEADSVLRDKDTFADVVSGSTNEQTTVGRKTLSGVTVTVPSTTAPSPERTLRIPAERRRLTVPVETRTLTVRRNA